MATHFEFVRFLMCIEILMSGEVVMITVAFLIVLFSVQRFSTSKVGLAVGPALFIWFCCLGGIGIITSLITVMKL
jgi:K+ transporter